jgi:multidrug efflux pump subunit AcrA (membrane-fusion protein)
MVVGNDNKAHQVNVEPGIRQGDHVQITKGLSGGEKVITAGAYGLPNETKVKVAETASPEGGKAEGEKSPADEKKPAGKDKE